MAAITSNYQGTPISHALRYQSDIRAAPVVATQTQLGTWLKVL